MITSVDICEHHRMHVLMHVTGMHVHTHIQYIHLYQLRTETYLLASASCGPCIPFASKMFSSAWATPRPTVATFNSALASCLYDCMKWPLNSVRVYMYGCVKTCLHTHRAHTVLLSNTATIQNDILSRAAQVPRHSHVHICIHACTYVYAISSCTRA